MVHTITDKETLIKNSDKFDRYIVKGIVYEGEFLYLLRYSKYNFLSLLGGAVEGPETPQEAFYREVLEESGIRCQIEKELPQVAEIRNEMGFTQLSDVYVARYLSKEESNLEVHESSDGLILEKVPINDAMNKLLEQECVTKQQQFLNIRDILILSEFLSYFKTKKFELHKF